jgi:hypothetical protein
MIETLKPGTERLYKLLDASVKPDMMKPLKEHPEEYTQAAMNRIFGGAGPTTLDPSLQSPSEDFRAQMIWHMLEIIAAVEMIDDLPLYIRRFPSRKERFSKLRYLRHHVEFYFHQVYVLEERLTKYLTFIKDEYNEPDTQQISQTAAHLCKQVKAAFKQVRTTRGMHVHQKPYEEKTMTQLFVLEGLAEGDPEPGMRTLCRLLFDRRFQRYRREWATTISKNAMVIEELINRYFGQLAPCLDSGAGQLLLPQKYR